MLSDDFIPVKPFPDFKWKWASLQCTEGLNDPVVLLGVLFRMRKLEGTGATFSSDEFAKELIELSDDISDSVGVDLRRRTGERNLIRNSGQYWRAVGLLPPGDRSGEIKLTDFGRKVAEHEISQTEFAAITIQTFKLPNRQIQNEAECRQWISNGLVIHPLKLLLQIMAELQNLDQGYITTEELIKIIIPLSGCKAEVDDYVKFLMSYRAGKLSLSGWPDCCTRDNDLRIAREYLLFLSNYGYVIKSAGKTRIEEKYSYNVVLDDEIREIINEPLTGDSLQTALLAIRSTDIASEVERKRVRTSVARPNQAKFRKEVLTACERCIITNVTMPEVLEAAHIKPFKYKGEDTVANGFAMRMDIHLLFDAGHLRISVDGEIQLSTRARMDYGALIPPRIVVPSFTNREFLRWRWNNYNGL